MFANHKAHFHFHFHSKILVSCYRIHGFPPISIDTRLLHYSQVYSRMSPPLLLKIDDRTPVAWHKKIVHETNWGHKKTNVSEYLVYLGYLFHSFSTEFSHQICWSTRRIGDCWNADIISLVWLTKNERSSIRYLYNINVFIAEMQPLLRKPNSIHWCV